MQFQFKIGPAKIAIEAKYFPKDWSRDYRRPYYRPFEVNDPDTSDLAVRIRHDPPPSREGVALIAELHSNWQLFRGEGRYRLDIFQQTKIQTRAVVLLNQRMNRADFHVPHPLDWRLPGLMEPFVQWWFTNWLARQKKGFILHGAAFSLENQTFIFFGPSGAGKTTIARWCRDEGGAHVLSDERIVVWREGERWQVSGTPWTGELHAASSGTAEVTCLAALVKGDVNQWSPASSGKFFSLLTSEAFLPIWDRERMENLTRGILQLMENASCGNLVFRNDAGIVSYLKSLSYSAKNSRTYA